MKRFTRVGCFIFLILLFIMAAPVTAVGYDAINSISPATGYTGETVTVTIIGANFTNMSGSVRLEKSGNSDIDASIDSWAYTTGDKIVCRFKISSSRATGDWNLVVVKGFDNTEIVKNNAFTILSPIKLTSITPTSAQADNDRVAFTIAGTGFPDDVEDVYLYNKNYDNITAGEFTVVSDIKIKGEFDLTDTDEGTYDVCVEDSYGNVKCGLSFRISTNEVGSIDISSSPSGASIYVDGTLKGTTPDTVDDLVVGSHRVILRKSGYEEWGKMVSVTEGDTVEIDADLSAITTAATSVPTTNLATIHSTVPRTTVKSTLKVPTTWPSATPTEAPVDPALALGAAVVGAGIIVMRRQ